MSSRWGWIPRPRVATLAVLAAAVGVNGAPGVAKAPGAPTPDLSGRWELVQEAGDRQPHGGERGGWRGGPGGGRRPGGHRPEGRPPGGGQGRWDEPDHRRGFGPSRNLEIRQEGPRLRLLDTDAGQPEQVLWTDGRSFERNLPGGRQATARARWKKDGRLVVKTKPEEGRKTVETWELFPERGKLVVSLRISGGPELLRVYQRAEGG